MLKYGLVFHENRLLDDSHEIPNIPCPEIKDMVKCADLAPKGVMVPASKTENANVQHVITFKISHFVAQSF